MTALVIALYLGAIVAANLLVAAFGPAISIVNAFLLIGLDLSSRDWLHDRWQGHGLASRMGLLILAGSAISYVLGAGQIAVASAVAFLLAGLADAISYQLLRALPHRWRVNGSNIVAAAVDSVVFPTLAFGGFLPAVTLGQYLAKVVGGFVWGILLDAVPVRRRTV